MAIRASDASLLSRWTSSECIPTSLILAVDLSRSLLRFTGIDDYGIIHDIDLYLVDSQESTADEFPVYLLPNLWWTCVEAQPVVFSNHFANTSTLRLAVRETPPVGPDALSSPLHTPPTISLVSLTETKTKPKSVTASLSGATSRKARTLGRTIVPRISRIVFDQSVAGIYNVALLDGIRPHVPGNDFASLLSCTPEARAVSGSKQTYSVSLQTSILLPALTLLSRIDVNTRCYLAFGPALRDVLVISSSPLDVISTASTNSQNESQPQSQSQSQEMQACIRVRTDQTAFRVYFALATPAPMPTADTVEDSNAASQETDSANGSSHPQTYSNSSPSPSPAQPRQVFSSIPPPSSLPIPANANVNVVVSPQNLSDPLARRLNKRGGIDQPSQASQLGPQFGTADVALDESVPSSMVMNDQADTESAEHRTLNTPAGSASHTDAFKEPDSRSKQLAPSISSLHKDDHLFSSLTTMAAQKRTREDADVRYDLVVSRATSEYPPAGISTSSAGPSAGENLKHETPSSSSTSGSTSSPVLFPVSNPSFVVPSIDADMHMHEGGVMGDLDTRGGEGVNGESDHPLSSYATNSTHVIGVADSVSSEAQQSQTNTKVQTGAKTSEQDSSYSQNGKAQGMQTQSAQSNTQTPAQIRAQTQVQAQVQMQLQMQAQLQQQMQSQVQAQAQAQGQAQPSKQHNLRSDPLSFPLGMSQSAIASYAPTSMGSSRASQLYSSERDVLDTAIGGLRSQTHFSSLQSPQERTRLRSHSLSGDRDEEYRAFGDDNLEQLDNEFGDIHALALAQAQAQARAQTGSGSPSRHQGQDGDEQYTEYGQHQQFKISYQPGMYDSDHTDYSEEEEGDY